MYKVKIVYVKYKIKKVLLIETQLLEINKYKICNSFSK